MAGQGRGLAALALVAALAGPARAGEAAVFAALDAVGAIDGREYDPRPVVAAVNALQPLGKARGVALLRRYLAARPAADSRGGLFIVLRTILDPPDRKGDSSADACTAAQREVAAGDCWRPPRLGGPVPPPPADLRSLRYPGFVLGDVPLSLVSGYVLGGEAEPLTMHLDALAPLGTWRAAPLAPKSAGEVRYLFMHYGQWSWRDEVGQLVEAQLQRFEAGASAPVPCLNFGLVCAPREVATEAALRATFGGEGMTTFTTLEHGGKRLLFAALTWPTDSESYVSLFAWSYSGHFRTWRLVLQQEIYGAIAVTPTLDRVNGSVVVTTLNPQRPTALVVPLASVPYGVAD